MDKTKIIIQEMFLTRTKKIYFFSDVPHLLRNNIENSHGSFSSRNLMVIHFYWFLVVFSYSYFFNWFLFIAEVRWIIPDAIMMGVKGTLSGLRQFLAAESPLKLMKNALYFTSKYVFVLKIFKFMSWYLVI